MTLSTDKNKLVELFRQLGNRPGLLESVFDSLPGVLFYVKDADARYLSVNQALIRRSGLERNEVLGKTADQLFPESGPSTNAQDIGIIESKTAIVDRLRLYSSSSHSGDRYWCLSSKFPVINDAGISIGLIGVSRDLPKPDVRHQGYRRLLDYLNYLEQNLDQNLLVSEAAQHVLISVDTLERLTREIFHLTPKQLMMKQRIDRACKLLDSTDGSITDIAIKCGYADHSAFSRQFKAATHLTPRQYRDKHDRESHPD